MKNRDETPLFALQVLSFALIVSVGILTILLFSAKRMFVAESGGILSYSPMTAIILAGICLALSFAIPHYLLNSARSEMKSESGNQQTEDLPMLFVPSIFVRYGLLAFVAIVGLILPYSTTGMVIFTGLMVVSATLMILNFPTERRLKTWLYSH